MGKIMAVVSGKGGTGKTSFVANTGLALAAQGHRVLCMDCDFPLRNLDLALGLSDQALMDLSDVLDNRCKLSLDIGGDDSVSADDDIGLPSAQFSERCLLLLFRSESGEHIYRYGEASETGECRLIVLICEDCCWNEDCDLLASHNRLERGTHCHLGFAVTYVTANHSFHRAGVFHILGDIVNCVKLAVGFVVFKSSRKLTHHIVILREGKALGVLSF